MCKTRSRRRPRRRLLNNTCAALIRVLRDGPHVKRPDRFYRDASRSQPMRGQGREPIQALRKPVRSDSEMVDGPSEPHEGTMFAEGATA